MLPPQSSALPAPLHGGLDAAGSLARKGNSRPGIACRLLPVTIMSETKADALQQCGALLVCCSPLVGIVPEIDGGIHGYFDNFLGMSDANHGLGDQFMDEALDEQECGLSVSLRTGCRDGSNPGPA